MNTRAKLSKALTEKLLSRKRKIIQMFGCDNNDEEGDHSDACEGKVSSDEDVSDDSCDDYIVGIDPEDQHVPQDEFKEAMDNIREFVCFLANGRPDGDALGMDNLQQEFVEFSNDGSVGGLNIPVEPSIVSDPLAGLSSDSNSFVCPHCAILFNDLSNMRRHVLRLHKSREFQCEECAKMFSTNHQLNMHKRNVHSDDLERFLCSTCDQSYKSMNSLRNHKRAKH